MVSIVSTRVVYLSELRLGPIPARTFNQTRAKWPELAVIGMAALKQKSRKAAGLDGRAAFPLRIRSKGSDGAKSRHTPSCAHSARSASIGSSLAAFRAG